MTERMRPPEVRQKFRVTRRGFVLTAGAGVGLAVGYTLWPGKEEEAPAGWGAPAGEKSFNAWIRIAEDGQVTVAVPQAEMGQGILSAFAQLVADELGADWRMMAAVPAPWAPAYANLGLAQESVRTLPAPLRPLAVKVGREALERLNLHLTAGSTSVRNYHTVLRQMAADAGTQLEVVAARVFGVPADEIVREKSFLVHGQKRMSFGEAVKQLLAADSLPAPGKAHKSAGARGRLLGEPLPRIDLPAKVDGSARFGGDVRLPDMLFAAIRHGPIGGSLSSVEGKGEAKAVKGENWVATVGITTFEARRALGALRIGFTKGAEEASTPALEDALIAALDDGAPVAGHGDVAAASGKKVVATYRVPYLAHALLEPMVATARVRPGLVEVWGPTQSLTLAHAQLQQALGVPASDIVVYPTLLGGGFGRYLEADCMVEAALIARAVKKPVQLCWTRREDMVRDCFRPAALARLIGRVAGGKATALSATVAVPSLVESFGARHAQGFWGKRVFGEEGALMGALEGLQEVPYTLPAFALLHGEVAPQVPLGYWRGGSHSYTAFFVESFLDELAVAAGADPLAFRLQHLPQAPRHRAVLKAVAAAAGWQGRGKKEGLAFGLALHEAFGSVVATVVEAGAVGGQIRLGRVFVAIDCGAVVNPESVRQQMEGGTIMGLSAALHEEATFADGMLEERNFDTYPLLRLAGAPASITTHIVKSSAPFGGVAEAALPPAAPALANALYAATGKRWRAMPFAKSNKRG